MKNKVISFLLTIMAVVNTSAIVSASQQNEVSDEYKVLSGLGMLPEEWSKNFDGDASLTRGKFFSILSEVLYPGKAVTQSEAAAVLHSSGIVDSPEDPYSSSNVTYAQAVKMVTVAAGYKVMAEAQGGWPGGYISAASYADITDGVKGTDNDAISAGNVVKLIYNMLHAEVLEEDIYSADGGYEISDETVLEKYRGLYFAEGLMTSNGLTALDEPEYYMPEEVIIGDVSYENTPGAFEDLIGCQVDVYYTEKEADEKEVVFISDKQSRNESVTIKAEYIESVSERVDVIEYYRNENYTGLAKLNLSPSMSVIYNGKAVAGYTKDDFLFDCGEVTFKDNNNDKKYDVAVITCYENMIAEGVDLSECVIYNGFEYEGAVSELEADKEYGDYIIEIYQDDTEVGIEGVAAGNVLTVAKSKSIGHNIIKIYLNDERKTATLSGYNKSENEITFGGETYKLAESWQKLNSAGAMWGSELKIGNNYEFLFDAFGKVAGVKQKATDGEFYAYLFNAYSDDDTEEVYIKYLSYDGTWYTAKLDKKVKFNGVRDNASVCFRALGSSKNTKRQLIRIKVNAEGIVTDLRTATETDIPDESGFTKSGVKNNKYFEGNRSMQGVVYEEAGAVWFNVPKETAKAEIKNDENFYFVTSPREEHYDYTAFDMDEFFCAKAFIIYSESSGNIGDYFLIEDLDTVLSSEGGAATRVKGKYGAFDEVTFVSADDTVLADVEVGDFIRPYFNGNGYITGYESVYKVSQGNNYSPKTHQGNWGASSQWDTGRLEDVDVEKGFMKVSIAENQVYALRIGNKVRIYDVKEKTFKDGTYGSLQPGDFLVFKMSYYNVHQLVAYRF